jgi:L-alanine-DL-glutamate epimerase-like enolase superfamily enzyme
MRLKGVRSRVVAFPLEASFLPAWGRGRVQSTLELVTYEAVTDDGLVGVGAASGGSPTL